MKTITVNIYGSYSYAECVTMGKNKLRTVNIFADKQGESFLKKAVAAYNRGESSFWTNSGDNLSYSVK